MTSLPVAAPSQYAVIAMWEWPPEDCATINAHDRIRAELWDAASLAKVRKTAREILLRAQLSICHYCRSPVEDNLGHCELDHIIPRKLAPQFTYTALNLTIACKRCNSAKGKVNTTAFSESQLSRRRTYPLKSGSYRWIHPCIHAYDDHITVHTEPLYEARTKIGRRVIKVCRLDKMGEVVARRRRSQALSAKDPLSAVLKILGEYPHLSDEEIAQAVVAARSLASSDVSRILEAVRAFRREKEKLAALQSMTS